MDTDGPARWTWLLFALCLIPRFGAASGPPSDSAQVVAAIEEYHEGLRRNAPERVTAVLAPSFTLFNGDHSGDPHAWQAHLYLSGSRLEAWPGNFLREAGPYYNQVRVIRVHLRGDAALVVTEETGRNRFRSWRGELVTYLLGRDGDRWRLAALFIRDIANP